MHAPGVACQGYALARGLGDRAAREGGLRLCGLGFAGGGEGGARAARGGRLDAREQQGRARAQERDSFGGLVEGGHGGGSSAGMCVRRWEKFGELALALGTARGGGGAAAGGLRCDCRRGTCEPSGSPTVVPELPRFGWTAHPWVACASTSTSTSTPSQTLPCLRRFSLFLPKTL